MQKLYHAMQKVHKLQHMVRETLLTEEAEARKSVQTLAAWGMKGCADDCPFVPI